MKCVESQKLNEMAFDSIKAMEKCSSAGRQFMKHFDKIYKEPNSQSVNHWCNEMQSWYDDTRDITMAYNNKQIIETKYYNWFFTAGSSPDQVFHNEPESEVYMQFCDILLDHHRDEEAYSIKTALQSLGIIKG